MIPMKTKSEMTSEVTTMKDDTIYRQAAIDVARKCRVIEVTPAHMLIDKAEVMTELMMLPSAQPDLDEWCRDCKEYDKERHSCPRWNRVIRQTVEDLKAEQPERKKERWERHYCEDGYPDGLTCSKCREWFYFGGKKPNFCPNCGADMRGDKQWQ